MGRKKIYESPKDRKRAWRERKKLQEEAKRQREQLLLRKLQEQQREIMNLKYEKNQKGIEEGAARCDKEENHWRQGLTEGQLLKTREFKPRRTSPRCSQKILRFTQQQHQRRKVSVNIHNM